MVWVRLDDHFDEHPKIAQLDDHAFALFVCGLAYCNRNLTDGFIPAAISRQLRGGSKAIKSLVSVGMWQESNGGHVVHDYTDYQPSRQQVLEEQAKKQAAGRAGGQASAQARAAASAQANPQASAQAKGQRFFKQNPSPVPVPVNSVSGTSELSPAGSALAARAYTRETDPQLLAEHLRRIAAERARLAKPCQPSENSLETNDVDG